MNNRSVIFPAFLAVFMLPSLGRVRRHRGRLKRFSNSHPLYIAVLCCIYAIYKIEMNF